MSVTTTRPAQAVAEWVKIFPKQITETYTSSVTFMKQLTTVAISTITYLKNAFPEDNYKTENFNGLKLKILKKICTDELAQFVTKALAQAFDAFEKKYLHQLALCFYEGECSPENLTEYHIFEYSYTPDGITVDIHSKTKDSARKSSRYSFDNVKERTMMLIRTCVVMMESFSAELPETYDISLRLYYNDDAPENYQAPGFLPSSEAEDPLGPTVGNSMKMGLVETPYHKLQARSYFRGNDNTASSRDAIPSQNAPVISRNELDFEDELCDQSVSSSPTVVCPCNKTDMDEGCPLLTCNYCGCINHGPCYGISVSTTVTLVCVRCSDNNPTLAPADERLATLTHKKRECLCIFRRALWWLSSEQQVSATALAHKFQLTQLNACKLMKLLHSNRIFLTDTDVDDLVTPRKINRDQLKQVMSKFFHTDQSNIVDRLLAETLSQGEKSDPIGDVLSPMEKINLQNSNIAKIIEHTPPNTDTEDSTLKQYREAILSNETAEEDMPLSGNQLEKDFEKIRKKTVKRKADDKKPKTGVKTKRVARNKD